MKPYKNPWKYRWLCPVCGEEKHSGGAGHLERQICGHMKNKHGEYGTADNYILAGMRLAVATIKGTAWGRPPW